ncbi:integrin alpha-PS2-like isoform X1 [Amphibalanus amphitrite]|uniref:integrin alpha-PS2-like isoform X1 n=1 Tax=Amphibalanus amphitrite TaxID=1232801 RepID=UPI001C902738|nr:integrin alpha-PS2-like isoform X1 [Amphibalanus amphitrite]
MSAMPVTTLAPVLTLLLLGPVPVTESYNVDVQNKVVYRGPDDAMFGFSVSGYTDQYGSWVLVGAPRAQTEQPGVVRGGAVYRCEAEIFGRALSSYTNCLQIPFDINGNNVAAGRAIDEKSEQWFGASVTSTPGRDNTGVVVACAPRYVWFSSNQRRREPVGTCYVAKNGFTDIQEYAPCRTADWGYHRQGSCQSGYGTAISKDGDRLFVGAVGSWYWQGQLFSQHLYSRPDLSGTGEGPTSQDDSYLGYSVAVGEFNGDDQQDVVTGMPRGANLTGKVVLYDSNLRNLFNLTGEQIGSYFGYSVCVADLNGDKLDDIVIGAPFYTDYSNTEGKYETGRVVIAYQSSQHLFKRFDFLDGTKSKSRFGLALTSLGDIDWDGYQDIAVGAPHDGMSDEGAVYIFHGTKSGINKKPTQVIKASELEPNLKSFGFSIHGGLDMDGNQYPDLVIGAHDSNAAVYLRSRPVVHVESTVVYLSGSNKLLDLSPENLNCPLEDNRRVACVPLRFCLTYDGVGVDKRAEFEVQFRLDARRPKSPRMFFVDRVNQARMNVTTRAIYGEQWCYETTVFVEGTVRDKLTPLVTEVHYSLVTRGPGKGPSPLTPVLNLDTPPVTSDTLSIRKNCGGDGVCVPDLQITARPNHAMYLLGSHERLTLDVNVFNAHEDAFESLFYLDLPSGVDYVVTEKAEDSTNLPLLCTTKNLEHEVLVCDMGNPLPANSMVHFLVHLMPQSTSEEGQQHYQFTLSVNSTNAEDTTTVGDNELSISLPIRIHTELVVSGISLPETVHYNEGEFQSDEKTHERHIGPAVYHVYELSNDGPSDIVAAEAYIIWPTYTYPDDKHLLYLLEQPQVEGPGTCSPVTGINPLQLEIEPSESLLSGEFGVEGAMVAPPLRRPKRSSEADFQAALGCGPTVCTQIFCEIGPLADKQNVIIRVRTRVWVDTIKDEMKDREAREFTVSSKMVARVTALPYKVDPSYMNHTVHAVTTRVETDDDRSAPVPWWVIVLASCGGVLILLILVLILYKLGFFKRRRRPGTAAPATNGGGKDKNGGGNGYSPAAHRSPAGSATNGSSTYYGFQNGDEAL